MGKEPNKKTAASTEKDSPQLGFAASYKLNNGAIVKGRINSDYLIGLSYILAIKADLKFTMCTEIDASKFKSGGHKVGFGIEFA